MKLLSFGEILFDVFTDNERLGGAPLNLAAHCQIQGATSYILSALGNDTLGKTALEQIKALGISTEYIAVLNEKPTGKCIVTLDENAVPSYNLLLDTAYDFIPCPNFNERFDVFAFGTLALRSEYNLCTVKKIIKSGICDKIYCDINIREPFSTEKATLFCLENADYVKISDEELPFVTKAVFGKAVPLKEAPTAICDKYPNIRLIIITLGGDGSLVYEAKSQKFFTEKAFPANVVSTVGAGDSFGASFITKYLNGNSISESLRFASAVSAYVVSKQGAIPNGIREYIKNL